MIRKTLTAILITLMSGCSADYWAGAYKPKTAFTVSAGPYHVKFEDSKDNNLQIEGLTLDPATKTYKLDRLTLINNSSDVVTATGNRALQVAIAQQTQVQYVQAVTAGISQIIGAVGSAAPPLIGAFLQKVPNQTSQGFDIGLPGGGSIGFNNTKTPVLPPTTQRSQ